MQGKSFVNALTLCIAMTFALFQYSCTSKQEEKDGYKPGQVKYSGSRDSGVQGSVSEIVRCDRCPVVTQVVLKPEQPTILDNIKAEITLDREAPANVDFIYDWHVNDVPVRNVTGNILPAGLFKKRDQVFVEVSPTLNGERGLICRSYFRVIHSAPPSLTLRDEQTKIAEVIELQLVGSDPDGDKITYALEDPIPVGMTIDKATGKIMWMPPKKEPGTYRFRASATDSDGSQTIKTFEFSLVMK